ncbi:unnamed protein product, partial [marine sediment metagenome]
IRLEQFTEAEALAVECHAGNRSRYGPEHAETIDATNLLIQLYTAWHEVKPDQGYDAEAADWRAKLPAPEQASSLIKLGMRLLEDGRHAEAEGPLGECLEIRQEALPEGHWLIFNTMSVLGESLAGQDKFAEAEPLLLEGYEEMKDHPEAPDERKGEALERIVALYEAWHEADPDQGYDAKAGEWRTNLEQWQATTRPATTESAASHSGSSDGG